MKVTEIFYSIQGESSYAGYPCVFVRLTGCNLRCSYCDTQYAYDEGMEWKINDIIEMVGKYCCPLVEITGGEPLLQAETPLLIQKLLNRGFQVLLETNGSIDVGSIDPDCHRIIDIKLPSSGESEKNHLKNISYLQNNDELKFVIGGKEDYLYAKRILNDMPYGIAQSIVINISPLHPTMDPRVLAKWILYDNLKVRLNMQLHKIIWPDLARGI